MPKSNAKLVTQVRPQRAKASFGADGPKLKVPAKSVTQVRARRAKISIGAGGPQLRVPRKSIGNAKAVFKNFSLSKFRGKPMPPNYVAAGQSPAVIQKRTIIRNLNDLNSQPNPNVGMTVAIPKATIQQLLPKLNQKTKTIDLKDLMNFVQQNLRGTQFIASGNPTLNRLSIRSRVQQIFNVKKGRAK